MRRGLSAAPGDIEGFVREISDAAIAQIERLFERAGLTVEGKPLGARAPDTGWTVEQAKAGWTAEEYYDNAVESGDRYALAYAWFARQFMRGLSGPGVLDHCGRNVSPGTPRADWSSPESRLGLDLWQMGRNIASEVETIPTSVWLAREDGFRLPDSPRMTRQAILEAVRVRLNWPISSDYDPPPPSKWPSEEQESRGSVRFFLTVLVHELTTYDQREAAKEARRRGTVNVYRLGLLLDSAQRVRREMEEKGLIDTRDPLGLQDFLNSVWENFTPSFAPAAKTAKQVQEYIGRGTLPKLSGLKETFARARAAMTGRRR